MPAVIKMQTILDIDGKVLYCEAAPTKKALIDAIAKRRGSLARADLTNLNLRQMKLSGADFTDASFANSNLAGSNLNNCILRGANFTKTRLIGVEAQRARFEGADLTSADFSGSTISFSNFRGVKMDNACFHKCNASSTQFSHSNGKDVSFSQAKLHNSDFSSVTFIRPNFCGANFLTTLSLAETHLPDRTQDAVIIDGRYDDDTKLCDAVRTIKRDATRGWMSKALGWAIPAALVAGSMIFGEAVLGERIMEVLDLKVSSGNGLILLVGLTSLAKMAIEEKLKEFADFGADGVRVQYRLALASLKRLIKSKSALVMAVAKRADLEPLQMAIEAKGTDSGLIGQAKSWIMMINNDDGVMVCDRKNLSAALALISDNERRRFQLTRAMTLVNPHSKGATLDDAPNAIHFHEDGAMTALWSMEGKAIYRAHYPAGKFDALPINESGEQNNRFPNRIEAITRFRGEILEDANMGHFKTPKGTHYVRSGKDGTILVYQAASRRLDNPLGPAVITPDGSTKSYRNGTLSKSVETKITDKDDFEPPAIAI